MPFSSQSFQVIEEREKLKNDREARQKKLYYLKTELDRLRKQQGTTAFFSSFPFLSGCAPKALCRSTDQNKYRSEIIVQNMSTDQNNSLEYEI